MAKINIKKVREIMKSRRWNTTRLAQKMGVSGSLISLVLNEKRTPTLDFMARFIAATGVKLMDVFFLP
jgi:transcriptional regulator with XRE-family HTH domain